MFYTQVIFIVSAACGGLYFFVKNRQFDYFSLAYFSALIYFLPGFFGVTSYHVGGAWIETLIDPEVYWIMIFVMFSIWLSACIAPYLPKSFKLNKTLPAESRISILLVSLASIGLAGMLATSGSILLEPEKAIVMESLGRWHILFYTASIIGLPVAFYKRQYILSVIFIIFLGVNLFIGFRTELAIGIISTLVVWFSKQGKQRLITTNWKMILAIILFGTFMFGYALIAFAVKAGMWDFIWDYFQNANTYLVMFTHSEPFVVQQTLNQVVINHFETNADHLFSVLNQFILFGADLGTENITFNGLYQPALFADVSYGMAANIWAQMWSAGGWPLLIFFTLVFNMVLAVGNATLYARSIILRAALAPFFCYWAFYIHRTELGYMLNLEKRLFLVLFFVIVMASIIPRTWGRGVEHWKYSQ